MPQRFASWKYAKILAALIFFAFSLSPPSLALPPSSLLLSLLSISPSLSVFLNGFVLGFIDMNEDLLRQ